MGEAVVRTWRESDDEGLVALWEPMEWTDLAEYGRKLDDPGNSPDRVWVAELDGELVGHAIATRREVYVEGGWQVFGGVGHLTVHPKARGLGLGRRLLTLCEQAAHRDGVRGLLMWTKETFVPAYSMYVRSGYQLVAQSVRHQVAIDWLLRSLPSRTLGVRQIEPAAPEVLDLRRAWATEAFPVSVGWDATSMVATEWGLFECGRLVGAFSAQLADPVIPAARVAEALGAMAEWKAGQGARTAEFWLTAGSPADVCLSPYTSCREEFGLRTMVKPLGRPLDLGPQYAVQRACWPW